jgi:hypothetical protein
MFGIYDTAYEHAEWRREAVLQYLVLWNGKVEKEPGFCTYPCCHHHTTASFELFLVR